MRNGEFLGTHILKYAVPRNVDLVKKYGSNWALITGGSSGIGRQVCNLLADKGLSIFVVALDDKLLRKSVAELCKKYKSQSFVAVGVDFSKTEGDYLEKIIAAVEKEKADVGIVINNAGVILMDDFSRVDFKRHCMFQMNINVMCLMKISHYFYKKWVSEKRGKGLLAFTSSCSIYFFQPYCAVYTASKALVKNFCGSLAIEAGVYNIDVLCILPQIVVGTNFWEKEKLKVYLPLRIIYSLFPSTPIQLARQYVGAMGRGSAIRDCGWLSNLLYIVQNFLFGMVDNFFIGILGYLGKKFAILRMK